MTTTVQQREDEPISRLSLWFGVLAGPLAWTARFLIGYAFVGPACLLGTNLIIHAVTGVTAIVTIVAGVISWRNWQRARHGQQARGPGDRSLFMSIYGLLSNIFFVFLIFSEGSAAFFVDPCLSL